MLMLKNGTALIDIERMIVAKLAITHEARAFIQVAMQSIGVVCLDYDGKDGVEQAKADFEALRKEVACE
jgi:hypothetical protein